MAELVTLDILRTGGVAGMTRRRSIAAGALTAAQAKALAALAASPGARSRGVDRFVFALTLTYDDASTKTIEVTEEAVPPALADIIR